MNERLLYNDLMVDVYLASKEDAAKIIEHIKTNEPGHPVIPELEKIYNEKQG